MIKSVSKDHLQKDFCTASDKLGQVESNRNLASRLEKLKP